MAKHTPGPWEVDGDDHGCPGVFGADGQRIAFTSEIGCDRDGLRSIAEDEANARLIAAAPELFRELTDFHADVIDQGRHDCDGIPGGCPVVHALARVEEGE